MQSVLIRLMHGGGGGKKMDRNKSADNSYKGRDGRQSGVITISEGEVERTRGNGRQRACAGLGSRRAASNGMGVV
jgi:hypothetical protein